MSQRDMSACEGSVESPFVRWKAGVRTERAYDAGTTDNDNRLACVLAPAALGPWGHELRATFGMVETDGSRRERKRESRALLE